MACKNCKCKKLKTGSVPVKVEVRQKKNSDGIMKGANTELFINGERFPYATGFKFEVRSKEVAKCTIEFLGEVLIDGTVECPEWVGRKGE
jgi:hypothetical protein